MGHGKKLLLSPALGTWKGAWKCKPSVRKCKPSVTWVSKKFDIRALRDAACHIHLTGLWTLKPRRAEPGPRCLGRELPPAPGVRGSLSLSPGSLLGCDPAQLEGERAGVGQSLVLSWEGTSLLSKAAMSWGEGLTCSLTEAPWVGTSVLCYLPPQIYKYVLSLLDCLSQKRPWKAWCTVSCHFPHVRFWYLGLKCVLTKSISVCFLNV